MKKENKNKTPYGVEKRFTFDELGPIFIKRYSDNGEAHEITCEPNGFAFYTLDDLKATFYAGIVRNYNALDEDGDPVELTGKEKELLDEQILDYLEANADINLL